ncbi:hypothetical protein [Actinoplanes sp. NPDC051494]|uniref:hypothetical protein n=1 Tax=Actinoplanes sp. NPDC051494 TaxID=3363907 RepID=UPI003799AF24
MLSLPVLAAGSPAGYAAMRGMTAVPYSGDDGVQRLMWLVMRYDPDGPYFLRTLFTQDTPATDGSLRGHVTAVRERLWTAATLEPALTAHGLTVIGRAPVQQGAAEVLTIARA